MATARTARSLLQPAAALAGLTAAAAVGAWSVADAPRWVVVAETLEPGRPVERAIGQGEVRSFRLRLPPGTASRVVVEQLGASLSLAIVEPNGHRFTLDGFQAEVGPEVLVLLSGEAPGEHRIDVHAYWGRGRFRLTAAPPEPVGERERAAAEVSARLVEADRALAHGHEEQTREQLEAALAAAQRAGDSDLTAVVLSRLGWFERDLSRFPDALAHFEAARRIWLGQPQEAPLFNWIALCRYDSSDSPGAMQAAGEAVILGRRLSKLGIRSQEAAALNNLGFAYTALGEPGQARFALRQAIEIGRELDALADLSRALVNSGDLELDYGSLQRAHQHYIEALEVAVRSGDIREEANALHKLGNARRHLGLPGHGVGELRRALRLALRAGDRLIAARAELSLGAALELEGDLDGALATFESARRRADGVAPRLAANAAASAGPLLESRQRLHLALERYASALETYVEREDALGEISVRSRIARVHETKGDLERALTEIEGVLEDIESVRRKPLSSEGRIKFLAAQRESYELAVRVLMALHEQHPAQGYVGRAAAVVERTRARALVDDVAAPAPDAHGNPEFDERARLAAGELRERHHERRVLLEQGGAADRLAEIEAEIPFLERDLDEARAEARQLDPRLAPPEPLGLEGMQALLDEKTLLLVYSLGEPQSHLWIVRRDGIVARPLADRRSLETLVGRARESLADPRRPWPAPDLRVLSRELLPTGALTRKRLVVIADGALQAVPFEALLDPDAADGEDRALIDSYEIVGLPSATLLDLQRRATPRSPSGCEVAVLADPLFRPGGDPRPGFEQGMRLLASGGRSALEPLTFSDDEAGAILALVPPDRRLGLLGAAATREAAMSPEVGRCRILHFATHGLLDNRFPWLSSLAFSRYDAQGRPVDDFLLGAYEIHGLDLPADLVVLSACETGLGQEAWGEGLLGLTRAFMAAGSRRVVVSLWPVNDMATAEFMERFYRQMLVNERSASEALRAAKLELREDPRWQAPYYWSGFVLYGDWEG